MKKILSLLLCFITLFSLAATTVSAAANDKIYNPGEVPKVFITTTAFPTRNYAACTLQIVDKDGGIYDTIIDDGSKFKIRGNSTSSGVKKPYNIKFSSKTNVLGMGKNKKWCLLANCYDKSLIRNQMVLDFASSIGLRYTPKYRVVELYMNGKLQGHYLLTDAVQASSSRVDIDTDKNEFILERDARTDEGTVYFKTSRYGIRFGINEPEEQTPEQYSWLMKFLSDAETAIASNDMSQIEKYFDIDSMVDFYIVLELFKNVDIDVGSTRFYIKDGKIYGGPCWDFDLSSGNCDYNYYWTYNNRDSSGDSTEGLWANQLWYRYLLRNDDFVTAVKERYLELQDIITNIYAETRLGASYIDSTVAEYKRVIDRNYASAGWSIWTKYSELEKAPSGSYAGEITYLRSWMKKRNEWLLGQYGLRSELTLAADSKFTLDGYMIRGVGEKTTVADVKKMFTDSNTYCVKENGAIVDDGNYISNGDSISCGGADYTVVILGDPFADGEINAVDYVFIKRCVLGSIDASAKTRSRMLASDVDSNGVIDVVDYSMVKRHVMGTYKIAS